MKTKLVTVTTVKTFEISISKYALTEENMKKFSGSMYSNKSEDNLYEYIGMVLSENGVVDMDIDYESTLLEQDVSVSLS